MEKLVRSLPPDAVILDLGAGGGSFQYDSTEAQVVAVDLSFPALMQLCDQRVLGDARAVPLRDRSIDLVIANHTLEHIEDLSGSLAEINRVLKKGGRFWASVPDAKSFDDRLYRFFFKGGGHVNHFRLSTLVEVVESQTGLRADSYQKLYSGLVFLNAPDVSKLPYYPARARVLAWIPPPLLCWFLRWGNYLLRRVDQFWSSNLSHYGWAAVFSKTDRRRKSLSRLQQLSGEVNVCWSCGASRPVADLRSFAYRFLLWRFYRCRRCGAKNILFEGLADRSAVDPRQRTAAVPETVTSEEAAMREVARRIFGPEYPESVRRWVDFWKECRQRSSFMFETFRPLALLDLEDKRILDVGCGTGGMGEVVGERSRYYVGADKHDHVLRFAKPAAGRYFVQCSGVRLPFPDMSFDYVFALDVLEHVEGGLKDQIRFLSELRRVLSPVGMICLSTPNRLHPFEGHTNLYFPQYLPLSLADRYVALRNPGFLREHESFSEIQSLSPRKLKRCLRESGLAFLHQLPCGSDRGDYLRHFPLRGALSYLGLGWYPHAEFWGILVRREMREKLRLKLRKNWFYEQHQTAPTGVREFRSTIDFGRGFFGNQLQKGWYWHETDARGFRWIGRTAVCHLQSRGPVGYLHVHGYSPRGNVLELRVDGVRVGEHRMDSEEEFRLTYLVPLEGREEDLWEVQIQCAETYRSEESGDVRDLGVIIFSVGLSGSPDDPQ